MFKIKSAKFVSDDDATVGDVLIGKTAVQRQTDLFEGLENRNG